MENRVFFSFHYQDIINFRANFVRNHWVASVAKPDIYATEGRVLADRALTIMDEALEAIMVNKG